MVRFPSSMRMIKKGRKVNCLVSLIEDDDLVAEAIWQVSIFLMKKSFGPYILMDLRLWRHDAFSKYMIGIRLVEHVLSQSQDHESYPLLNLYRLAYDFDMTGLVSPPYAQWVNLVIIEKIKIGFIADFGRDESPCKPIRQEFLEKKIGWWGLVV